MRFAQTSFQPRTLHINLFPHRRVLSKALPSSFPLPLTLLRVSYDESKGGAAQLYLPTLLRAAHNEIPETLCRRPSEERAILDRALHGHFTSGKPRGLPGFAKLRDSQLHARGCSPTRHHGSKPPLPRRRPHFLLNCSGPRWCSEPQGWLASAFFQSPVSVSRLGFNAQR